MGAGCGASAPCRPLGEKTPLRSGAAGLLLVKLPGADHRHQLRVIHRRPSLLLRLPFILQFAPAAVAAAASAFKQVISCVTG